MTDGSRPVGSEKDEYPKVIANFAITWDGRISTKNRTPSDFSTRGDKRRFLEIRAEGDAVLVGAATVASDTMTMGLPDLDLRKRRLEAGKQELPLRVLVSSSGDIQPSLRLFSEEGAGAPIFVYTTQRMPLAVREWLEARASVIFCGKDQVDLKEVLRSLRREHSVKTLICEGGGRLFLEMLRLGLVSELCLTLCPLIFGGTSGISLTGPVGEWLPASTKAHLTHMEVAESGGECFTRWRLDRFFRE
jgi:riboflavin-specific deaminase-like protein